MGLLLGPFSGGPQEGSPGDLLEEGVEGHGASWKRERGPGGLPSLEVSWAVLFNDFGPACF